MTQKLGMNAIDKVGRSIVVPVLVDVKLRKLQAEAGISYNELVTAMLATAVQNVELDENDLQLVNDIIQDNIAKRKARMSK
jgi:hypothetical protein